jgi:hypothetical protein
MALVETTGWSAAQMRVLRAIHGLGPDAMLGALDVVGADIVGSYRGSISSGRSPAGKFKKLSPKYAKRKAKKYPGRPILVASGAMVSSLAYKSSMIGPGHYRLVCGAGGVDGDGVKNGDKALWHIDGTPKMPARDFGRVRKHLVTAAFAKALRAAMQRASVPQSR